ncbi:hypothetical protein OG21DRAFT_1528071 [Imleria badia]|nr:hypothetical protein OG21DRAFT_1528071 [Imleria badia]
MAPPGSTTVIVPVNLGAASKYEDNIFPLAYHYAGDPIRKGSLLLTATLDEMIKIGEMGIDINTDRRFHFNARVEYEALAAKEAKLQSRQKSINPFTVLRHYRAARMFHAASKALFVDTKHTSERIQREERLIQAVPSTEMHTMNVGHTPDTVPQGATVIGIAVELSGPLDDDARQKILAATSAIALHASASDPFIDNPRVSQLSDDTASVLTQDTYGGNPQEAEPTSPGSPSYTFNFYNSVLTAGSNIHEMALHHGSETSGLTRSTPCTQRANINCIIHMLRKEKHSLGEGAPHVHSTQPRTTNLEQNRDVSREEGSKHVHNAISAAPPPSALTVARDRHMEFVQLQPTSLTEFVLHDNGKRGGAANHYQVSPVQGHQASSEQRRTAQVGYTK